MKVSYNPQHNGVPERNNRSIIDYSMAMIHDQELPMFFWVEACSTMVYVWNWSPQKILGDKTLEEEFLGMNPDI
jgi:hypothetical protein